MNDLKIFECEEFGTVRLTDIDGKTYFAASDVQKPLDMAIQEMLLSDIVGVS